jgi:hypothetical protein
MIEKVILLELDKETISRYVWSSLQIQEYLNTLKNKPKRDLFAVMADGVKFKYDTAIFDHSKVLFQITNMEVKEYNGEKFLVGDALAVTKSLLKEKIPEFNISRRHFKPIVTRKCDSIIAINGFTFDKDGILIKPKSYDSKFVQSHMVLVV